MKIALLGIYPTTVLEFFRDGVVAAAVEQKLIELVPFSLRDFAIGKHRKVDDHPFGGGDGMVIYPEVVANAVTHVRKHLAETTQLPTRVIYLTPQGAKLNQTKVRQLYEQSQSHNLCFLCGRYAGVDQRAINTCVDEELSIGDYVLSGGELAAAVCVDALARLIPGVLGNPLSSVADSFGQSGEGLLEAPLFTQPRDWQGQQVPRYLVSGDHQKIARIQALLAKAITAVKVDGQAFADVLTAKELLLLENELTPEEFAVLGLKSRISP